MKFFLLLFISVTIASNVYAWGPEGHMIVAEFADHQLTPEAKNIIKALLPNDSLAEVSNWADTIKGQPEWEKSKPWHFIDIPDGQSYSSIVHTPEGDVITAINDQVNVLSNKNSSMSDKQIALKFIVHLVGDIHQPLHVGRPSDHGGNMIKVRFEGWNTNLHQLWDSTMISKQNLDYVQYVHYLESQASFNSLLDVPALPYEQIVNEDMSARAQIYSYGKAASTITLDAAYMHRNLSTMNTRLILGGKRLASLLNAIFSK